MYTLTATKNGDDHPDHMYITFQSGEGDALKFNPISELDPGIIVCTLRIDGEIVSLLSIANKKYINQTAEYYNKQKNSNYTFNIDDNVIDLA